MKEFKKIIFLFIVLLFLLTLQGVNAIEDCNSTQDLQSDGGDDVVSSDIGSFGDLQSLINNNTVVNLDTDYVRKDGESTIVISKNVTINGNGHYIDADNGIQALSITGDNVILNNVTIKNGNSKVAGAIYWSGANGILANSSFENNKATGTDTATNYEGGGAIYWAGENGIISNTTFTLNFAAGHGGAIWWDSYNGQIENCVFEDNIASKWAGAVYWKGNDGTIKNSNFTRNSGKNGGSLAVIGSNMDMDNLIIDSSNSTLGALYWNTINGVVKNSKFYNNYNSGSTGGGAIYTTSTSNLTTIENCEFVNNSASKSGGAIYAYGQAIVDNCIFYNNYALEYGGAIFFNKEYSEVRNSKFVNNNVSKSGGAVYISNRFCTVDNSTFIMNSANYAGAVYFSSYKHELNNSYFEENKATFDGGAVYIGSYGTVVNNTDFVSNSADRGGAIYNYVSGTTVTTPTLIANSNFNYNNATAGGALASFAKFININDVEFSFNKASYGSAIYADRTSYTISNSTLLNNTADSVELILNFDSDDYSAKAIFKVNNTLLNAIYRVEGSMLLDNVTYWGVDGISNSDDGYIEDTYAINQNVTLTIFNHQTMEIYNVTNQTNGEGVVIFKDLSFKPGNYTLQAVHNENNYYTEISSNIETFSVDGTFSKLKLVNNTILFGENALVEVSPDATGNVSIFIGKYYIGEINNGFANISLDGLAVGTYGALITYYGDDYYDESGYATQIKIILNRPDAYSYINTEYANTIQAGINNTLTLFVQNVGESSGKNVKIRVLSEGMEIANFTVENYEVGQYYKFSVIDTVLRPVDNSTVFNVTHKLANYTIIVEDDNGLINITNCSFPIIYNGYLGKDYEYPQEFNTEITREYVITGDIMIVNSPHTVYASSSSTYRVENFTLSYRNDVVEALLYVPYNWDSVEGGDYNRWHAVFNNGFITPIAHYRDQGNLGNYGNRGYGLVVYNVTEFVKSGNNIFELTKVKGGSAVYPSSLMVLTNNSFASAVKNVYIVENADLLAKQYSVNSTVGELTELTDINNRFMIKSDLYVFAASAEPDEGNIIFNGKNITNVWNGNSSSLEMFKIDVTNDLAKDNVLFFEATGGTILSLHKIIVVESKIEPGYSAQLKTEYTNTVQAGVNNTLTLTVVNNGTGNKKNVLVKVLSENNEIASFIIENYVVGENNIFTITDPIIRPIDENTVFGAKNILANYTVIVDDSEFNFTYPVRYNGNLGKDYAYPQVNNSEITREYEINGEVIIITKPDSMYMSSGSSSISDVFNIDGSDIVEALLYVAYNWDNVADGDYLRWNVTVNDNLASLIAHYRDQGNLGNYGNRGYGLVVYNVTEFVKSGDNNYTLNKISGGCAVYPYSLIVLTNDTSSNVIKKAYISENADLLSKTNNKALTVGAKTSFNGINLTNESNSNLYVFAASAQNSEGNIIFNDVIEENIWNGSSNSLACYSLDIGDSIAENNNVFFESTGATILALHQVIVVEIPANEVIVVAPDVTKYFHGPERFVVNVTDAGGNPIANKSVNITVNGVTYTKFTDETGTVSMGLGLNSGVYDVTTKVDNTTVTSVVTVLSTVEGSDLVKVFRNATPYTATFKDSEGNFLAKGTQVQYNINGVMYKKEVGENGVAKLNINLAQGTYIITAINPVTGEKCANNITVLPRIIENKDIVKYYKNGTQYTVKLIGDDGNPVGAGEVVTFNINGVFYNRTTNENGVAKININLSPGDYVITADYKGCKVSNNIKVLPVLFAEDLNKTQGGPEQFVAKVLDGQGNPYEGQNVTFNINGVFYNKVTDSNGEAKLNINLQAGEYIITSSYNGTNVANKVTVTPRP